MRVCIISVCHNTYKESLRFLDSIDVSIRETGIKLDLFFVDNSTEVDLEMIDKIKSRTSFFSVNYLTSQNFGYFPSIIAAIENHKIVTSNYQYFIISNVDLSVSKSFFLELESLIIDRNIGVYAPAIMSSSLNDDRNPKIKVRPSAFKLRLNRYLFSSGGGYVLLRFINTMRLRLKKISKLKSKRQSTLAVIPNENIYAAHGSFIILTNELLRRVPSLNYPIFLFGEEIYIAETARKCGLAVVYSPNLLIHDTEHASTSMMKTKAYRNSNVAALDYILKNYKF